MRDFAKPALLIALVFAMGVVVVHDIGGILFGYLRIEGATQRVAEESVRVYTSSGGDKRAAGIAAVEAGKRDGIEVYGWDLKESKITVWARARPSDTWVFEPAYEAIANKPFTDMFNAEFKYSEPVR